MEIPEFKFALRADLKDKPEFLPTRAHAYDTGFDCLCAEPENVVLRPFDKKLIRLGFRAFCPPGYWFELKARSSTFAKLHLSTLYGTIDETYEGEVLFAVQWVPPKANTGILTINFGDKICQIVPHKRDEIVITSVSAEEYDALCAARKGTREAGGFGSTGT